MGIMKSRRKHFGIILLAIAGIAGGCSSADPVDPAIVVSLAPEPMTAIQFEDLVTDSTTPIVANVWASWCLPCQAEAPLLAQAHAQFGDDISFVGINVQDRPDLAAAFISDFGLDGFEHYADQDRAIPASLGGAGVPITYFIAPGGEVVATHLGIIDERTLVNGIQELLSR